MNCKKLTSKEEYDVKKGRIRASLIATLIIAMTIPTAAYGDGTLIPQQKNYQGAFADTTGTWCDLYVQTCYEAGLMDGKSAAQFDPTGTLTNAQITVICARLLSLLRSGDRTLPQAQEGEAWYQPAYELLVNGGILAEPDDNQSALPSFASWQADSPADRERFVALLSGTLSAAKVTLPSINNVSALPDVVHDTRLPDILAFYNAGILSGKDDYGSFAPSDHLNRGQAAAMLARIVGPDQRLTFTLKPFDLCRDVLGLSSDTVLLYADGEPVTAELFGSQLATSLVQWGKSNTQKAQQDAIRMWVTYSQCYFALAKSHEISLSDQQIASAQESSREEIGYLGHTAAYALRFQEQIQLDSLLKTFYEQQYGDKAAMLNYSRDLAAAAEAIHAEPAPALKTLDLNAVWTRAMDSPYAYAS